MPAAGARGSSGGGGGGRSYRSSSASSRSANTGRDRSSKKNDQDLLHRAAATQGWFSLSKYTDSDEKYFDDRRREESPKVKCRVLQQFYDEPSIYWRCDSGEKHSILVDSICKDFRKSMVEEKCDGVVRKSGLLIMHCELQAIDCLKADQEAVGSGVRSSASTFFGDISEEIHRRAECKRLKMLYDECRSDSGDNHPKCQNYRMLMIRENCKDYLMKSDQEAADTTFRSSVRKFFRDVSKTIHRRAKCRRLKDLYDECRSDLGDNHCVCQEYRKKMIKRKCNDYLKKSNQEALDTSFTSSVHKFFRDFENRILRKVECKRLEDCYDKCKLQHGARNCQDYLKLMSKNKCPDVENGA